MTTRGFLLGKFMPFHEGHAYLCQMAAAQVDELSVLVCTRDCEPIPGPLRYQWVKDSLPGTVRVLHLHRDIPQEPADHPQFWDIWRDTVREFHPEPIDRVFGSEAYVARLAQELDARPVVVDQAREAMPICATDIRRDPVTHWRFIPAAVKPYYQNRVCVLGPESSGKSLLSQRLAEHFHTLWVPEYGRSYDANFKQGENWQREDFAAIAQGHRRSRELVAARSGPLYFEDTDLLQTLVWAQFLLGAVPDELAQRLARWPLAKHYLLLRPDVPWVNDGTRYDGADHTRQWFFDQLEALLQRLSVGYTVITGSDWEQRLVQSCRAVEELIVATDDPRQYR